MRWFIAPLVLCSVVLIPIFAFSLYHLIELLNSKRNADLRRVKKPACRAAKV